MMLNRFKAVLGVLSLVSFATLVAGMSGCDFKSPIKSVTYDAQPNLETLAIHLNFQDNFDPHLSGSFLVKEYGEVEITQSPFSVGFRLNTKVLYDQDYINLKPTQTLPTGQSLEKIFSTSHIPMNRAMVSVEIPVPQKGPNADNSFKLYLYLDVLEREWIGVVATFEKLEFPNDLIFNGGFLMKDKTPRVIGSLFGPTTGADPSFSVSVFTNVKSLLGKTVLDPNVTGAEEVVRNMTRFGGGNGGYYNDNPGAARALNHSLNSSMVRTYR